ncbi:ATP-dependent helicase [Agrobacterium vitis]|uniref:UvrD-helicase domain-containing protein n=1 Tax=Rhizobium/Agrobacterium group TaxID=227290 RepID=UPI0008730F02|nr:MULTISPECIES: UvrD-helicase domain-containing protein [Rhizobium/Agrobacterium group]MCF1464125.1 ATP-dependent helicase [Allorhizobium ampelinum]MCF1484798.1 ATP-dependent helicase [Allorhizobium ampelinum]MUO71926.1 AAA family ATPase [Agrobacterium vitis]
MTSRSGKPDTQADVELRDALSAQPPKHFVMVAGAGSGKTTSLIKALEYVSKTRGDQLRMRGQQIACITYTEVAVNEIRSDVGNDPLCRISTIHSFLWSLIQPFQSDIRDWVLVRIDEKIAEEEARQANPKTRAPSRPKIEANLTRLREQKEVVSSLKRFTYGTGSDYRHGILGHADILKLVPALLEQKQLLRDLLAAKYPVLFVDESQDTMPAFIAALRTVTLTVKHEFCLGFFGDPMQKIFSTGSGAVALEEGWIEIRKPENFRCPQAVLKVINAIRAEDDRLVQTGGRTERSGDADIPVAGTARIFILPADEHRTTRIRDVREYLSRKNTDPHWKSDEKDADVRMLVLLHRAAASRLGFPNLYAALHDRSTESLKEGLADGTAWPLRPFLNYLLPLANALRDGDEFELVSILRGGTALPGQRDGESFVDSLKRLHAATTALERLFTDPNVTVRQVLQHAIATSLMTIDERMAKHLALPVAPDLEHNPEYPPLLAFLACPAKEFFGYRKYLDDLSPFSTQQGVKGAQFDRVMVLLDDEEGEAMRSFSYGKYFGITALSATDIENIAVGKDSAIERTRRLFYVCCSRAVLDLAVVWFAPDVDVARAAVLERGFFRPEDVLSEDVLA